MSSSPEDYQAKAAETLAAIGEAKTEAERTRLRRAHGVYLKLATHDAEAAARAAARPEVKKSVKKNYGTGLFK